MTGRVNARGAASAEGQRGAPRPLGVTVVIPCLDEERSIGQVVLAAREGLAKLDVPGQVLVVDNGCTDRTAEVAREHGAEVVREDRHGYGSAIRRGFEEATYEVLVMADGDLTYDLSQVDEMIRPILRGEADFVVGNRLRNLESGTMPFLHQYLGNPALTFFLRLLFHHRMLRDAHCGMRAIRGEAYRRLRCVTTGMEFASEMIVRAIRQGLRIEEQDIAYHPRLGESKLRPVADGWRHLRFMVLHSPIAMLFVPGALLWALGILVSAPLALGPVLIAGRAFDIHFMMMGGLLNLISIQVLTIGLLTKAYAHVSGLHVDPAVQHFYDWFTFEKSLLIALPLVLLGALVSAVIVFDWMSSGFGELDMMRPLFFAILLLVNGLQVALAGYLLSIMTLPRHVD